MSDQAGSSDHLTTAITQLRQYNKDERMDCQSQEKQGNSIEIDLVLDLMPTAELSFTVLGAIPSQVRAIKA